MSNKRIPYFDFYPVDFMRGVRGLTATEVGVYTMLLCRIYEENGPVEYSPVRLSAYCGVRESVLTKAVDRLIALGRIEVVNGMLSDDRAMKEIDIRETKLKNSSRAGKASAEKRQQNQSKASTDVEQPFNHTDTDKDKSIPEANASGRDAPEGEAEDFSKQVFDRAVAFLGRHGVKDAQARSFVGKLRKDGHTDGTIFEAFAKCAKAGAVAPIPWITKALGAASQPHQPAINDNVIRIAMENVDRRDQQRAAR